MLSTGLPRISLFFLKKRVKFGWLSLFWRSDKWKIEFVHFFWEVKVKLKLLEIENKKWKWKQNFREISRNKNLAGDCGASYISDGIFLLSCMKKSFPDYSWSKAALLHWKSLITCIHQRGKDGKSEIKFLMFFREHKTVSPGYSSVQLNRS